MPVPILRNKKIPIFDISDDIIYKISTECSYEKLVIKTCSGGKISL